MGRSGRQSLMEAQIRAAGRQPRMRTTLYGDVAQERRKAAFNAPASGRGARRFCGEASSAASGCWPRKNRKACPIRWEVKWVHESSGPQRLRKCRVDGSLQLNADSSKMRAGPSKSAVLEPSWLKPLAGEFEQPYMHQLDAFFVVRRRRRASVIFPKRLINALMPFTILPCIGSKSLFSGRILITERARRTGFVSRCRQAWRCRRR